MVTCSRLAIPRQDTRRGFMLVPRSQRFHFSITRLVVWALGLLLPFSTTVVSLSTDHWAIFMCRKTPTSSSHIRPWAAVTTPNHPSPQGHACLPRVTEAPRTGKKSPRKWSKAMLSRVLAFSWAECTPSALVLCCSKCGPCPSEASFGNLLKLQHLGPRPTSAELFV